MKIKLSKAQWSMIGKKAGWIKKAEDNQNFIERDNKIKEKRTRIDEIKTRVLEWYTDSPSVDGIPFHIDIKRYGFAFQIDGLLRFYFEPAQHGGMIDPSWKAHYGYEGLIINDYNTYESPLDEDGMPIDPPKEIIALVKQDVEDFFNDISDQLIETYEKFMKD